MLRKRTYDVDAQMEPVLIGEIVNDSHPYLCIGLQKVLKWENVIWIRSRQVDKSCCDHHWQNKFKLSLWFAFQAQDEEFQTFQRVHVWMAVCWSFGAHVQIYDPMCIHEEHMFLIVHSWSLWLVTWWTLALLVRVLFGTFLQIFAHKTTRWPEYYYVILRLKVH